jgi:hypothetical protein
MVVRGGEALLRPRPPPAQHCARICKRLRRPGIDSEESVPPSYEAWQAGPTNSMSYRPARLGIDSWTPLKVYKYGLRLLGRYLKTT